MSAEEQTMTQCDQTFFRERVNGLFDALSSGKPARVAALFPSESTWKFHTNDARQAVSQDGGLRIAPVSGVAEKLAAAVGSGDARGISNLFPQAGTWQLEVVPTLKGFIRRGSLSKSSSSASRDGRALTSLVEQFRGTSITWSAPSAWHDSALQLVTPQGTVIADQYLSGPLRWRITKYPSGRGHTVISGVAKLGLYCEGGVFGHIVMTPRRVSPKS